MDTPLSEEHSVKKTIFVWLAVLLVGLLVAFGVYQMRHSDPYIQSVLSSQGDPARGQVIFQQNCSVCHGLNADGRVGPSLHHVGSRKTRIGLIHQVTSGATPPMPQFQPSPQEMADLLKYLETL
ncbi:cytochrome C [filamentous cyanobacterium CCP1]|nr:cytochrome C [filamentous cyanobacterium CCP2]PSB56479.1 cytochrome C [filamentous cyanobacterium CCP1]